MCQPTAENWVGQYGGVCIVSVCGRRQNTENECTPLDKEAICRQTKLCLMFLSFETSNQVMPVSYDTLSQLFEIPHIICQTELMRTSS